MDTTSCTTGRAVRGKRMLMLGFVLLGISGVASWYLRRHSGLGEDLTDAAMGFGYGAAIGAMILGIWLTRRR